MSDIRITGLAIDVVSWPLRATLATCVPLT